MRPVSDEDLSLQPGSWDDLLQYLPAVNNNGFFTHFHKVEFTFRTLEPVVDSSNIAPDTWKRIAAEIKTNYLDHTGFIIIHGTDTMAYTASALSFMLIGLSKPVIVTGSQLPVFHPRTDAIVNLSNAIYLAAYPSFDLPCIPEVCICFNDDLLRGNRSSKISTQDLEGFDSPNCDHLAWLEQDIRVNLSLTQKRSGEELKVMDNFSDKVVNVTLFPGYNSKPLLQLVETGQLEGIVLKTFGSGNIPNTPDWKELVDACVKHNVLILATTQCLHGGINLGRYKASEALISPNVISGFDITSEAALTKLMWVIGNFPLEERANMLSKNLNGEITLY